jgi:long-chain fatty acid transport protein
MKRLSLGVSFTLGLHNTTSSASFVGNADELNRTLVVSNDIGVQAEISPHFAISYDATDRLHLSATAHSIQQFDIVTGITTLLPNGNKQNATRTEVHDYLPWRFGLGVAVDVVSDHTDVPMDAHELTLCATAVLGTWSSYRDRQGERPVGAYAWSNTLSLGVGARHHYGQLRSFLDLQYVPSSVPLQTGRSNYVDNDRVSTSGGIDYRFELFSIQWRVGLQAQLHMLLQRYQQKLDPTAAGNRDRAQLVRDEFPDDAIDTRGQPIPSAKGLQTNNPGWPGFASSGLLGGGGVTLALLF